MPPEHRGDAFTERDDGLLLDMVLAAEDALTFTIDMSAADFASSRLHQNAVIRSLEIIGEAASRVSATAREACPQIPWREIIGMRHAAKAGTGPT